MLAFLKTPLRVSIALIALVGPPWPAAAQPRGTPPPAPQQVASPAATPAQAAPRTTVHVTPSPVPARPPQPPVPEEPVIKGAAVAIGGALRADNDEVWGRIVQLAGGRGARFVVFGTASEDPEASAKQAVELLQRRGAVAEALPVAPKFGWVDLDKVVRDPALIAKVKAAKGVFFTGGLQERIVDVLQPGGQSTPMLDAIWDVYRRGGVVAGTSAGAAIMSKVMFRDAPSIVKVLKGQLQDGKQLDRGLGFVGPDVFVDQHFLKRGRFGRLIPAMRAKGYQLGLGVEENTAAVFKGDQVEIVGAAGALFIDLGAAQSDPGVAAFNLKGARVAYVEDGDKIDLKNRAVVPSPVKLRGQRLESGSPEFKPYYTEPRFVLDMLGDQMVANAMRYLIDSNQSEVKGLSFDLLPPEDDPLRELGFLFRLYKAPDSVGWSTDEFGGEQYTVINVRLDITPVRLPQPLFSPWTPP
ncbi:cyanophycinase [Inhella sp.]|uniref:cyanophycinase n=1 Tax=Inhella sp. TaxID=1921806 RepID=UPI0035B0BD4B